MPKIICAQCKAIEDVDEKPAASETVLCSDCKKFQRKQPKPTGAKPPGAKRPPNPFHGRDGDQHGDDGDQPKRRKHIPRKKHGTRVMLPITCKECGETDTLDYVPKGANLDEVLCQKCAREQFGTDSDWARIDRSKEKDKDKEWEFECSECGVTDYLPFEPKPEREYQCNMCRFEHDVPKHERLAGRKKKAGGVFIRRPSLEERRAKEEAKQARKEAKLAEELEEADEATEPDNSQVSARPPTPEQRVAAPSEPDRPEGSSSTDPKRSLKNTSSATEDEQESDPDPQEE